MVLSFAAGYIYHVKPRQVFIKLTPLNSLIFLKVYLVSRFDLWLYDGRSGVSNRVASMKVHWWTVITMSIGLKFFWHLKQRARFVFGLVAV